MRVLITGGAGFVGSNLARFFRDADTRNEITAFDNLHRRGSELNLPFFKKNGIEFVHGDIRNPTDLHQLKGDFDLFIECSAEPSVLAGVSGSPGYVLETNLVGTLHCLEFARQRVDSLIFLSTSRVYSMNPLREIQLLENQTRFEICQKQFLPGISSEGINESFPVDLPRSFYGATKLCSEIILQEYTEQYGLRAVINRCGVIAGPGQFGKIDQGVFTYWVVRHLLEQPLNYFGYGGTGKQVRDILHPHDLFQLIQKQASQMDRAKGRTFNVGGGREGSVSLCEWTALCQSATGKKAKIHSLEGSSSVDIPLYISDNRLVFDTFGWKALIPPASIAKEIAQWAMKNQKELEPLFS